MKASLQNVIKLAKELVRKDKDTSKTERGVMSGGESKAKSKKFALSPELTKKLQESGVLQKLLQLKEKAQWSKSAQSALDKLKFDPQAMMVNAKDQLSEFWASVSPETKRTLLNSAIGAMVGGGLGGAAGGYMAEPGHGLSEMASKGMLGSLLGGAAAGLGTAGYQAATSGRILPGEERSFSPTDRVANTVVGGMLHNPATTAGAGLGAWGAAKGVGNVMESTEKELLRRNLFGNAGTIDAVKDILRNNPKLLLEMITTKQQSLKGGLQMLGLPAGIGMGWLVDRYLKGKND